MKKAELRDFLVEILKQTEQPKITFEIITTKADYKFYKRKYRYLKLLLRALRAGIKTTYESYYRDVLSGTADITKLLLVHQLNEAYQYYLDTYKIIKEMLRELRIYFTCGVCNYFDFIINIPRRDINDYRR